MKPSKFFSNIFVLILALTILIAGGCQAGAANQVTVPTPTLEIVTKKNAYCPLEDCQILQDGGTTPDEKIGAVTNEVTRARLIACSVTCSEPTMKGKFYALEDGYETASDHSWIHWGYGEIVTDEGGVWTGQYKGVIANDYEKVNITLDGDGLYKGLQMQMDYDGGNVKLQISKMAEK